MLKLTRSIFALCLSFAALAPVANAATSASDAMKNNVTQACQSDIQKYCSDVSTGGGKVMACLKSHEDKLSSGCSKQWQASRAQWKSNMKAAHAACSGDVQRFCSGADTPKDITNCLSDHTTDLSSACKDFRSKNQG
jgi:hypothetical protein